MENKHDIEDRTGLDFMCEDVHIPSVLAYTEMENSENEKIWVDFMTTVDEEVKKFNNVLVSYGMKVTTKWDEDEEGMEWIDFNFRMIDETNLYSYCFLDARNYGNEHFQFNRTSVKSDLIVMSETLRQRFGSDKVKELYEGISRLHQ